MEVIGKVVKADEKSIVLQIPRSPACAGCSICWQAEDGSLLEAENHVQARVGDLVKVVLPEKTFLKASLLAYGLPLFFFLLGYPIGSLLSSFFKIKGEGLSILFSFLFLSLSFLALRLLYPGGSSRSRFLLPQAKEIVSPDRHAAGGCDLPTNPNSSFQLPD